MLGDTELPSLSPGSGTPAGRLPPARTLPDLSRPGAELLLVPCLEQDVSGIGDLGDSREGQGGFRERDLHPLPTHPHSGTNPDTSWGRASPCPPPNAAFPPHATLPWLGRGTEIWHGSFRQPRAPRRVGKASGPAVEPPWLDLTLRTKVWRLSGISRRVHLRTSWTAEQAACSFGLEPCRGGGERLS